MVSTEITHPKVSADTLMSLRLTHTLPSTITQVKTAAGTGTEMGRTCWTHARRWRRSPVSAAAYAATLTSRVELRSHHILTCFAASVHVTDDCPAHLRADRSRR